MNADTDAFKSQFVGIQADQIAFSKTGATADNEIDALSGATITTTAMTNGVNAGLAAFRSLGGEE
jgi:electron transport complex protein RnfG